LVEQVAQLEKIDEIAKNPAVARECFRRNHFTDGLKRLVEQGFARLAGQSEQGSFYLTQAMGGGKTHSLLAFGLLADDPKLRKEELTGGQSPLRLRVGESRNLQRPSESQDPHHDRQDHER
jgi:hypothetical protein